jgi:heat shock protein HslJ
MFCFTYRLHTVFALISVALAAAGCSGSAESPTSPSAGGGSLALTTDQVSGVWTLAAIQPAGQAEQNRPADTPYTLALTADSRLSTRADCNTCSGAFTISGQILTAGPALACTRAACPTMAFETTYVGILSGDSTVTLTGNTLVLTSARGVLRFTR